MSKSEEQLIQEEIDIFEDIFRQFCHQNPPADSIEEADHFFSTEEIKRKILDLFNSIVINEASVYERLKDAGYKFTNLQGNTEMLWMLKKA